MKFLVVLVCLVSEITTQAKSVNNLADLQFIYKHVTNPRHTAEEWDAIYATDEADIPEYTSGLVPGTVPQSKDAGKVFVNPAERIINGTAAARGQFPWQVLYFADKISFSGGSLISPEWVLTAAHCLDGYTSFQVILGSTSRIASQAGAVSQNARQAIIHADWHINVGGNDIGLLRLTSAVTLTNYINVVRLPRQAEANTTFVGTSAIVSGFGITNMDTGDVSNILLYANVTITTNAECARTYGSYVKAEDICSVGTDGRAPCIGDSGGPLVVRESDERYTLVGVVAFTTGNCAANNASSGYTRVSKYLTWISSNSGIAIPA